MDDSGLFAVISMAFDVMLQLSLNGRLRGGQGDVRKAAILYEMI